MLQTALHLVNNPLKNLLRKQAATGSTYPAMFQQELRWFSSLTAQVCDTCCSLWHLKFSLYNLPVPDQNTISEQTLNAFVYFATLTTKKELTALLLIRKYKMWQNHMCF